MMNVSSPGTYKYRVRANRDNIWWDWSRELTVSIGDDVTLEFIIDMQDRPLTAGEVMVLLGNIEPLGNVQNSPDFTYHGTGIYTTEVTFENSYVGETLAYRFGVSGTGNPDIETFNREYQLTALAYQSLDTVRFNLPAGISEPGTSTQPEIFSLGQVYPNPFNATLSIPLEIGRSGSYEIQIYDLTGKARGIPRTLSLSNGSHLAQIDFKPLQLASGVYFIRVQHEKHSQIIKCQLLK